MKSLCSDNPNSMNSAGCSCDGKKQLSATASSVFVTGMTSANAPQKIASFARADQTSYMDAFVQQAWHTNPDWIQVYLGVKHDELDESLFRSFPGAVHEYGETYNAGSRPWYASAAPTADTTRRTRKDQVCLCERVTRTVCACTCTRVVCVGLCVFRGDAKKHMCAFTRLYTHTHVHAHKHTHSSRYTAPRSL